MSDTIHEVNTWEAARDIEVTIRFLCYLKGELKRRRRGCRTDQKTRISQQAWREEEVITHIQWSTSLVEWNLI
jgi:hypothetical protein